MSVRNRRVPGWSSVTPACNSCSTMPDVLTQGQPVVLRDRRARRLADSGPRTVCGNATWSGCHAERQQLQEPVVHRSNRVVLARVGGNHARPDADDAPTAVPLPHDNRVAASTDPDMPSSASSRTSAFGLSPGPMVASMLSIRVWTTPSRGASGQLVSRALSMSTMCTLPTQR